MFWTGWPRVWGWPLAGAGEWEWAEEGMQHIATVCNGLGAGVGGLLDIDKILVDDEVAGVSQEIGPVLRLAAASFGFGTPIPSARPSQAGAMLAAFFDPFVYSVAALPASMNGATKGCGIGRNGACAKSSR